MRFISNAVKSFRKILPNTLSRSRQAARPVEAPILAKIRDVAERPDIPDKLDVSPYGQRVASKLRDNIPGFTSEGIQAAWFLERYPHLLEELKAGLLKQVFKHYTVDAEALGGLQRTIQRLPLAAENNAIHARELSHRLNDEIGRVGKGTSVDILKGNLEYVTPIQIEEYLLQLKKGIEAHVAGKQVDYQALGSAAYNITRWVKYGEGNMPAALTNI